MFFRYVDRPGVVGAIGTILGTHGINIGAMQVSRREAGGEALMTLTVDNPVPMEILADTTRAIGATASSTVDLSE
jgi:D-3-phosphoglycerate dehydrogenase